MCGFDRLRLRTPCELLHSLGREVLGLAGTHEVVKVVSVFESDGVVMGVVVSAVAFRRYQRSNEA